MSDETLPEIPMLPPTRTFTVRCWDLDTDTVVEESLDAHRMSIDGELSLERAVRGLDNQIRMVVVKAYNRSVWVSVVEHPELRSTDRVH